MVTRKAKMFGSIVLLGTCSLGGCGGVRNDLTPELMSLDERPVEVSNRVALSFNANKRMIWNDLNRASLMDRPSRLTPHPMPH
jgi:hypothetical protein